MFSIQKSLRTELLEVVFGQLQLLRRFMAAFSQDGLMNILQALKGFGKEVIDKFDALSESIQDDVLKAFPVISSFVTSSVAFSHPLPRSQVVLMRNFGYHFQMILLV